jgi:hypothetical protein
VDLAGSVAAGYQAPGTPEHGEDGKCHRHADRSKQEQEEDKGDDREGDEE